MSESDNLELEGTVIDFSKDIFKVEVDNGTNKMIVTCKPSGKMRLNSIKIVPGDKVRIEVSPYDLSKGRITYRAR